MTYIIFFLVVLYAGFLLETKNYFRGRKQKKRFDGYEHLLTDKTYKKSNQKWKN